AKEFFTAGLWDAGPHDDLVEVLHLAVKTVPFGYGFMLFLDTAVAAEVCEELFTPIPPHTELALNGVEVFMNASGSHHQLRKLDLRMRAFIGATNNRGGVYMYSNHQGCDGGRLYYDGCACIVVNGEVVAQGSQFSIKDVEVVVAQIDLDAVHYMRYARLRLKPELGYAHAEIENGDEQVKSDAIRIGRYTDGQFPTDSKEFAKRIFYTYDSSSADINPIGSISKQDLRRFLKRAANHLGFSSLADIEAAPPTAELEPIRSNYRMTYNELSAYGRLRKIFRRGPVSMFKKLCFGWGSKLSPSEVADKVKHFFKYYSINRHKMTVLTPSYHAEFLYNSRWPYQFRKIDELVDELSVGKGATTSNGTGVVAAGSADPKAVSFHFSFKFNCNFCNLTTNCNFV
ncbi:glutamine-dependent NAD(+) synthetase, partial [Tanacetum coccineum]